MNATHFSVPPIVSQLQRRSLQIGVVGLVFSVVGAFLNPEQFFRSYLIGYLFCIGVALGCLALVMLQYLTGGAWGLVIRRLLEAAARTLPLLALMFVPLIIGMSHLYTWTHLEKVRQSALLMHKHPYLNVPFFLVRLTIYFAVWMTLEFLLNHWGQGQDQYDDPRLRWRLKALSGPGLVLYGLTVSFAAVDWIMSIQPAWFSTIFGMLVMTGQGLSALSFTISVAILLATRKPMSEIYSPALFHDLGKLLLMFTMLWAYLAFSQFLLIWAGNLPSEIPFYLHRWQGGWQLVGLMLILFHFGLPFLLLLSREVKQSINLLAAVTLLVILMRFVDLFWLTVPEFSAGHFRIHWLNVVVPIGITCIWLSFFASRLKKRPLLPLHDLHFAEVIGSREANQPESGRMLAEG